MKVGHSYRFKTEIRVYRNVPDFHPSEAPCDHAAIKQGETAIVVEMRERFPPRQGWYVRLMAPSALGWVGLSAACINSVKKYGFYAVTLRAEELWRVDEVC